MRKFERRTRIKALMGIFRAQQASTQFGKRTFHHCNRWPATIVAALIIAVFLIVAEPTRPLKVSETHLTSAQIIGAALALILSLSIIPAQRAAEAFSPAVLKLYAQDRWLRGAFLTLALTTTGSVLLGTNFLPNIDPRLSIGIEFLLLGVSFDALRIFHERTLDLLIPQTAIRLIIRECSNLLRRTTRIVERLSRVTAIASGEIPTNSTRALYFSASQISGPLLFWIGQLGEIAHKLIARRDTSAANDIISAMGNIGMQYSDARRNSLILLPDFDNLFAGGVSDINNVLNPIYESIRVIGDDAAKASNELVLRQCINTVADMSTHAMTMVHSSHGGWKKAPLAFSPCFWLGRCTTIALRASMEDAILAAIGGFQYILLNQNKDVDTSEVQTQSLETLFTIAAASYAKPDAVWGFSAVRAMLLAARHDIDRKGYDTVPALKTVLEYLRALAPGEVAMEKAGKRRLQVFPAYDMNFEASVPALLERVARRIEVDPKRPSIDPFHDFLEAAEDIRNHYRELSKTDFENTLARKWVVDSIMAAARVHWALLVRPPKDAGSHLDEVEKSLGWLVSWISAYFAEQPEHHGFHANEAADSVACLTISLLEHDRIEAAHNCASTIARLAEKSTAVRPEPYALADLHQRIETLARAADALGKTTFAAEVRKTIQKPATVSDTDWPRYLEAQQTRFEQLDETIQGRHNPYGFRDDPISELQRILRERRGT